MSVAYEQPRAAAWRRLSSALPARVVPFATVAAVAGWFEWVRLRLPTPSLIDDWFGITYSRPALHALLHGDYSSSAVDFAGRYRPAYTGLWNYAQWHLLGDPSIAIAAAWGVLRVALFIVAVWLLAAWSLGQRALDPRPLLWLAPLAVAMTPATAVDLVRYGPADPMMVSALILGLAAVGTGVRMLLLDPGATRRNRAVALVAGGYLVYLIGVYSKEASVCLLAFLPFFLKWLGPTARTCIPGSRTRRWLLGALAILLVAPLLHVGVRLALAVSGGHNPYPGADFSVGEKLMAAGVLPLVGAPGVLGSPLWVAGAPAAVAVALRSVRRRDSSAWLLLGILTTGYLMSALALSRGDATSRYYIPWLVAVAAVALRAVAGTRLGFRFALTLLVVGIALSGTRTSIDAWARTERSGSTAVEMAKAVVTAGCPLYLANFDLERRVAIPRLLSFGRSEPLRSCTSGSRPAYALKWSKRPLPPTLVDRCRSSWQKVRAEHGVNLSRCDSFRGTGIPDQDATSGEPLIRVVRLRVPTEVPSPGSLFQPRAERPGTGPDGPG